MDFNRRADLYRQWFEQAHPDLQVVCVADFDETAVFLSAARRDGVRLIPGHSYLIDKKTGDMQFFSPMMDLEKYGKAMKRAVFYKTEENEMGD